MKIQEKTMQISSLQNEVKDFHPFLKGFFSTISDIKSVEYTHGNSEYGSDFILISENQLLLQEIYIGVVVKTGKITQTDVDEIKRQIDESFKMPKVIFNGKKEVFLNEVWLVTNDTITVNAKEKINHYFTSQNINIIPVDKLIQLIDKYYEQYWDDMSAEVLKHISKIRSQVEEEDKRYTLIPTLDPSFYIEPEIIHCDSNNFDYDQKKKKKKESIDIRKKIESDRFIILEAGMGFGKSKLIRELVKHYTDTSIYKSKNILVLPGKYSELFQGGELVPEKIILDCSICEDEISDHKKIVFFIDGFDEKQESIESKISNIKKLKKFSEKETNYGMVIATRGLQGFSEKEFNGNIKKYEIKSLSTTKIIIFLEKLCKELDLKNRIIEDLKQSPLFKELPQSPIAAILLARLFQNNAVDLPANLPELYSMYLELILGKWDIDKGIESLKEYEVVQNILHLLSYYYIDNDCDYITYREYFSLIEEYISARNLSIDAERIDEIITKRSGVLIKNRASEIINYSHRTFVEYMYARGKSINSSLAIDERAYDLSWMNIYYFYIGIKKDCTDILEELTNIIPESEPRKWLKVINLSNFYMAAITTPYTFFENNLYKVILEAVELHTTSLEKGSTVFGSMSPLMLLWWIQLLMKEQYSYDFFKKALESTVLQIEESDIDEDKKIYAIFFTGAIGQKLGVLSPYEYLVTEYKEKLPASITIGLLNETKNPKYQSDKIKKSQKWLDRKVKNMHRLLKKDLTESSIKKLEEDKT